MEINNFIKRNNLLLTCQIIFFLNKRQQKSEIKCKSVNNL